MSIDAAAGIVWLTTLRERLKEMPRKGVPGHARAEIKKLLKTAKRKLAGDLPGDAKLPLKLASQLIDKYRKPQDD